jgi:hypothetical protein
MQGQFFKDVYKELFKYSTIYVAGDMKNSYEEATGQLYNEGKITESNEEGHKKILERIEKNKKKKLADSHRGISGA